MGDLIDLELYRAQRDQEAQEMAELEQLAREEGVTVRELVRRLAQPLQNATPQTGRDGDGGQEGSGGGPAT